MGALIAALLPLAEPLIKGLIKGVEGIFGPKTGDVKLKAVVESLMPVLEALAKAGKIPGLPDNNTVTALVELVFQSLKKTGEITSDTSQRTITVPVGAKVTIEL